MNARPTIITVLDGIGPTSMPLNEFVFYRARHCDEEQLVVSYFSPDAATLAECGRYPEGQLRVLACGGRPIGLAGALRSLARDLVQRPRPALVHLHHPNVATLYWPLQPRTLRRLPTLFTVHNTFAHYSLRTKLLSSACALFAAHLTFVSESSYRSYPALLKRRRAASLTVVPNGVDLERIDAVAAQLPAARAPHPKASYELLTVGRLIPQKHQSLLLELLAALPPHVTLTVIGSGALESELRAQAQRLGLGGRLRLTGLIPRHEVFKAMQAADLFVSSSRWEGLPVAVLEAMAMRLPVLLSDIGPHRELAARSSGVLLLPFELAAWHGAVEQQLALHKSERRKLGCSNREAVERYFSLHAMHQRYGEIYRTLWRRTP